MDSVQWWNHVNTAMNYLIPLELLNAQQTACNAVKCRPNLQVY